MAFEIGDKVIYPNHGLGIVERIETKTIMGTTCGFYQLRMANETTVFVPVDNVDGVGLRRAVSDEEVERLFDLLGDGKIESHQNWKGRFKDNSDRMRTGSIYDVVEVLKSLTFLSKSKSLSFREKRMLDRAKFLVVSEITEVLGEKTPQVEEKVDKRARALLRRQGAERRAGEGRQGDAGPARRRRHRATPRRAARRRLAPRVAQSRRSESRDSSSSRGHERFAAARTLCAAAVLSLFRSTSCSSVPVLLSGRWSRAGPACSTRQARSASGWASRCRASGSRSSAPSTSSAAPAVYASNHTSNIDPPAVFLALRPVFPRLRVLYKAELRKLPVLVWAFDLAGFVPIERANKEQSWPAVDRAAEALARGQFVRDFSRRHAQPDGGAAAVQEGRLRDGDQGAGAGGAVAVVGRPRGDAQGQPVDLAGDGDGHAEAAGRDRRA